MRIPSNQANEELKLVKLWIMLSKNWQGKEQNKNRIIKENRLYGLETGVLRKGR